MLDSTRLAPIDDPRHETPSRSLPAFHLSVVSAAALKGEPPPREWLVEGLIPMRNVTLLSGDGGIGKSLLALQLAVAVALGREWIGRKVRQGGVLCLSAEDDIDELHRRLRDVVETECATIADLRGLDLIPLAGKDAMLAGPDKSRAISPTPLFKALHEQVIRSRPSLVIIDTVADCFGGDENTRAEVRAFVGLMRSLAGPNTSVLLLSHPSLTGMLSESGISGSTAWNNSVRSRLYFDRVKKRDFGGDPDLRVLLTKKANYGPVGAEVRLRWQGGTFVPADAKCRSSGIGANERAEEKFLTLLDAFKAEGRNVSDTYSKTYAPKCFADDPRAEGIGKEAFDRAMKQLFAAKLIKVEQTGSPSRLRSRLVRC